MAKNSFTLHTNSSIVNAKISSPRISQEDTAMNSQFMPVIKGASRFTKMGGIHNPSDRNFMIPGGLTLDTDSELDASKLQIRDKLVNNSTTRNIRNKTIDVPSLVGSDFFSAKKTGNTRSNLGGKINSATRRVG